MVFKIALAAIVLLAISNAWVRFSPSDPDQWHKVLQNPENKEFGKGLIKVLPQKAEQFGRLWDIAQATPRTNLLAGSVDEGAFTVVTRTKFWGFPDFSTIWVSRDSLVIYARARFGSQDSNVNAARVSKWDQQLSGT